LPTIIQSVQVAVETSNPTYPFFQLANRILVADTVLQEDVLQLQEDPSVLVGMSKPTDGIWLSFVYYWKFFWHVIYKIIGNVWLIFLPLLLIYNIVRPRNTSEPAKNWMFAIFLFLIYLFVTNTIILIHEIVSGQASLIIPEGYDTFGEYFMLFKYVIPFHGLWALIKYLIAAVIA
jgi:hypothetical protein